MVSRDSVVKLRAQQDGQALKDIETGRGVRGPKVPGIHKAPPAAVAVTTAVVYLQEAALLPNTNVFTST